MRNTSLEMLASLLNRITDVSAIPAGIGLLLVMLDSTIFHGLVRILAEQVGLFPIVAIIGWGFIWLALWLAGFWLTSRR